MRSSMHDPEIALYSKACLNPHRQSALTLATPKECLNFIEKNLKMLEISTYSNFKPHIAQIFT